MADINRTLKDAAYVAIGFAVLAYQRAQVQRREVVAQVKSQRHELETQVGGDGADSVGPVRAYVTGGHGFVGTWLLAHLSAAGDEVVAPRMADVDVTDPVAVFESVSAARPDAVYHLGGLAHVGRSWDAPDRYFRVNALGTLHVLEAARRCSPPPRVLVVSSAEVYG